MMVLTNQKMEFLQLRLKGMAESVQTPRSPIGKESKNTIYKNRLNFMLLQVKVSLFILQLPFCFNVCSRKYCGITIGSTHIYVPTLDFKNIQLVRLQNDIVEMGKLCKY